MSIQVRLHGMLRLIRVYTFCRVHNNGFLAGRLILTNYLCFYKLFDRDHNIFSTGLFGNIEIGTVNENDPDDGVATDKEFVLLNSAIAGKFVSYVLFLYLIHIPHFEKASFPT